VYKRQSWKKGGKDMDVQNNTVNQTITPVSHQATAKVATDTYANKMKSITKNKIDHVITDQKQAEQQGSDQQLTRNTDGVGERVLLDAIEKANSKVNGANSEYSFSVHEVTKQIMVKVTDKETGEVIKEIPSQKALDAVAMMWEFAGLLVDEKR
jgi:flagellar protein FlaG